MKKGLTVIPMGILAWLLPVCGNEIVVEGNPVFQGADPDVVLVGDTVWVYPTHGPRRQFFAFSSRDLRRWQRHGPIFDFDEVDWISEGGRAWAPGIIERDEVYYLYYSIGPKPSHIGVATSKRPEGPFEDSGQALLSDHNHPRFEAIDAMVFKDPESDRYYFYAGGSAGSTLRVFELNDDMISFNREIEVDTPPRFTEGVFMHHHNDTYYLSYSHGSWRHASYSVHYATAPTPTGPWTYRGAILQSDERYKGPGHHSFLYHTPSDQWLIFYHRYENVEGDGPYRVGRVVAIDRVEYDENGLIKPIRMTAEGVHYISD